MAKNPFNQRNPRLMNYLHAYKAPNKALIWSFYAKFCTFCASFRLKRTVFTRPIRSLPTYQVGPRNQRNPRLINDLRSTKVYVRKNKLFMQNKANFRKVKFNVNDVLTGDYDQLDTWSIRKTKPIQSQSKPIQSQSNPNKPNFTLTCLWRLKFMAHSGTMPPFNRVRAPLTEVSNSTGQIDDILGVKSMKRSFLLAVIIAMLGICNVWADWPQYLGPNRNATSDEKGLLRSWPAEGPKVLWTFDLGAGYGGGAISKGKVYLLDRVGSKQDVFRCIDLNSGKELWSFTYDAPGRLSHPGSRSTPAIDGNYIYTCGSFGDVYCFDQTTHKPVWKKNVWKDYGGGRLPMWGISQNPLIYGDLLILASQTEEAGVVAYDKTSGGVKWVSPALPGRTGYVTPAVVNIDGRDQLVMITATSRRERGGRSVRAGSNSEGADGVVLGMDIKDGKTLWTYKGFQCRIPINNVVPVGDGRLFISGGYMAGSAMFKVTRNNGRYAVKELYTTQDFGTHVHPSILYKGHLYGHGTTNSRRDGMTCMSVDGKLKWKTGRSPLFDKGGFILVDGLMLSVDGRDGILYIIEPNPEGFKKLASVDLLDTKECWGALSLSEGKLLIRDQKRMKCVAVR